MKAKDTPLTPEVTAITDSEPNSELHKEFRSLTALLSLVNSFNRDEPPSPRLRYERSLNPPVERVGNLANFASKAITTLLTRDVEVIAVTKEHSTDGSSHGSLRTKTSFVIAAQPREQENLKRPDVQGIRWRHILSTSGTDVDCNVEDTAPCVLVPPGQSHWPAISRKQWHGFKIRGRDPLNNHLATLADYCKFMKKASQKEQLSLSQTFKSYIVSTCWRKMHRRISHWFSQGFIYILANLPEETLRFSYREYTRGSNRWRDDILCDGLLTMPHETVLGIMNQHPAGTHPKPTQLLAACKKMLEHPNKEVAYNIGTCVEFHHIFVATLASYAKPLATLHTIFNAEKVSLRQKAEAAAEVKKYSLLIWMFAYTPMLKHHLEKLDDVDALNMPIQESCGIYRENLGLGDPLGEQDEDGDIEVEVSSLIRNDHHSAVDQVFREWLNLQVIYFESVYRLSDFYRRFGDQAPDVEISLLAVKTPYVTMEPWERTIQKAIVEPSPDQLETNVSPINTETAMGLIRDLGQIDDDGKFNSLLSRWDQSTFFGTTHCNAALASLIKYGDAINSVCDRPLCLDIKNLDSSAIAISRLCCPVCWELITVLRADIGDLHVRGHHAIMSPVALPVWLPVDILQHMVDRFRGHLRDELTVMYEEAEWRAQRRSPSLSEDSDSDSEDDDDLGFSSLTT